MLSFGWCHILAHVLQVKMETYKQRMGPDGVVDVDVQVDYEEHPELVSHKDQLEAAIRESIRADTQRHAEELPEEEEEEEGETEEVEEEMTEEEKKGIFYWYHDKNSKFD